MQQFLESVKDQGQEHTYTKAATGHGGLGLGAEENRKSEIKQK